GRLHVPDAGGVGLAVGQVFLQQGVVVFGDGVLHQLLGVDEDHSPVVGVPPHDAAEGLGGEADGHVGAVVMGIGGHVHHHGGGDAVHGDVGLGGAQGHGDGGAVPDGGDRAGGGVMAR